MAIFSDFIIGLGLEAFIDKGVEVRNRSQLQARLTNYLERQEVYNETCSNEEEVDFEALFNYVRVELIEDVKMRLFGNRIQRRNAYNMIIQKAKAYAQANSRLGSERVTKLINEAINILRDFYRKKSNKDILLFASEFDESIEELSEVTQQTGKDLIRTVTSSAESIHRKIDSANLLSIDRSIQSLRNGDISDVEKSISTYLKSIGPSHELYPYYGYGLSECNGELHLRSIPLSNDAIDKYPPKIRCFGTIEIKGQPVTELSPSIIRYTYNHQLPISLNVFKAQKFLGDVPDPDQTEAKHFEGKSITIPPKPFPKAFPCSINLDGNTGFDYVLLRTQEILDDGTVIISNSEQENFPYRISISIHFDEQKSDFNIILDQYSSSDLLRLVIFMKKALLGSRIIVKDISSGINLIQATIYRIDNISMLDVIDKQILFCEKVISIEKYFCKSLVPPVKISSEDIEIVNYISSLINNKEYCRSWEKLEITFKIDEENRRMIHDLGDTFYGFSYVLALKLNLFGEILEMSIKRMFKKLKFFELDRLKKKMELSYNGEIMRAVCIPDEIEKVGTYTDIIEH